MNIIDINFNFELFDETINNLLNKYNISKEELVEGFIGEEEYKDIFNKLSKMLDGAIKLIDVRLLIIDEKLNKNLNITEKEREDLLYEKKWLMEDSEWYSKLRDSITTEYYNFIAGNIGLFDKEDGEDEELE